MQKNVGTSRHFYIFIIINITSIFGHNVMTECTVVVRNELTDKIAHK
jgi:hypothetical protein